uniref:Uncharacterized protein n=1 Tax=Rhizophora mucronata TaxID=61149 RepID=A0A2P2J623_RHIMU
MPNLFLVRVFSLLGIASHILMFFICPTLLSVIVDSHSSDSYRSLEVLKAVTALYECSISSPYFFHNSATSVLHNLINVCRLWFHLESLHFHL